MKGNSNHLKLSWILLLFGLSIQFATVWSQTIQKYQHHMKLADEAYHKKAYNECLIHYEKILELFPQHPRITYQIARIYSLLGNERQALAAADRVIDYGLDIPLDQDTAFIALKQNFAFQKLLDKLVKSREPINHSNPAFTLAEKDFIPEGIAYDPVKKKFYLGSTAKCRIIEVDVQGNPTDFTSEKQDGLRSVLGMKVDPERRILWVNSIVGSPPPVDVDSSEVGWSGVFKYDIDTGRLIKKYTIHVKDESHLFNDLVYTIEGDVYLSDSDHGAIYKIPHDNDELELFLRSDDFTYPNGIALSAHKTERARLIFEQVQNR